MMHVEFFSSFSVLTFSCGAILSPSWKIRDYMIAFGTWYCDAWMCALCSIVDLLLDAFQFYVKYMITMVTCILNHMMLVPDDLFFKRIFISLYFIVTCLINQISNVSTILPTESMLDHLLFVRQFFANLG